ncbi:malto-oligosyltrehalose trehalohydrolase [Hoeflea ulvae]|uniref:Malto-oligosyltrehalose trehalohydrolase n=1 Tax=Hoeflea ulvae TaxID=2983764 RepID=A0ABT3YLW9_9HYPH|nr:malto-oligosyltrehalose trehalohydrolase [Hoeflea ulvae]MCY0096926.1 malto-oligosyltrehalose trehalohydrolase [Hoeflea ulvae]
MHWGPKGTANGKARFRLWAPDRETVDLEIGDGAVLPMNRAPEGWFEVDAVMPPGTRYRFILDNDLAVPDPASRQQSGGVHGWSVVTDPDAYRWTNTDWCGRPWEEAVILELHAGVLGGFAGVSHQLEHWRDLGITVIELMPVGDFGGTRNWGYDGVLPYAVAEDYGTPDELKALIDRAHGLGMMVMLDVVYNHFGPDGNYIGSYASGFFDDRASTPWGGAVAVMRHPVRRYFIENALMWLDEYRFDGLRFDAVHAIGNTAFLDEMAAEIRSALPDRQIHLVLENEHNDADRLLPGQYDAQWNDDFHNVMHVLLTGEIEAYYAGFADDPTVMLARCLSQGFVYQGEDAGHGPRGKPSGHLVATSFVSFLQNHDQVGNRALGERLLLLADPARLRAATALLLLCPQIPMMFMGDEVGSHSPFLFFTDFHDELAEAVRNGRREEFSRFEAFSDPETRQQIPDPNAHATFEASVPRPGPDGAQWLRFYADLIALRHQHIVPRLKGARGEDAQVLGDKAVSARWRMADGSTLTIALNLGDGWVKFPAPSGALLFALGEAGGPASFAAWLNR